VQPATCSDVATTINPVANAKTAPKAKTSKTAASTSHEFVATCITAVSAQ
jgi:hypothetical protein